MLVLTRKSNQSITIGREIRVTVLEVDGDQVRLGIEAPHDVPVRRSEIVDRPSPVGKGSAGADTPS
ncbi:MAG TPA: carbon storage regulator CsrA [Candidatus Cybelea sp.]|jgi:carbon storage regulator|nr:carbon storage regulator CsrA [Candidatus Cybelea sp.]